MTHKHHHHGCCEHEDHDDCCHVDHTCCHEHDEDDCCDFPDQLLEVADEAWMELLKEKIKKQIEATSGKKLDELAKLVNEANHSLWHGLFAEKRGTEEYKKKLNDFFHSSEGGKRK